MRETCMKGHSKLEKAEQVVIALKNLTELHLEDELIYYSKENIPDYVRNYIYIIASGLNLRESYKKTLMELLGCPLYKETMIVTSEFYAHASKNLNVSVETVKVRIRRLIKGGVLIKTMRGVLKLNPRYFSEGLFEAIKTNKPIEIRFTISPRTRIPFLASL